MKTIIQSTEFRKLEKEAYLYKFGSNWGLLYRFLVVICKILSEKGVVKKKRKSSSWQVFLGEQMRNGKSIQESAALWKNKKQ